MLNYSEALLGGHVGINRSKVLVRSESKLRSYVRSLQAGGKGVIRNGE